MVLRLYLPKVPGVQVLPAQEVEGEDSSLAWAEPMQL